VFGSVSCGVAFIGLLYFAHVIEPEGRCEVSEAHDNRDITLGQRIVSLVRDASCDDLFDGCDPRTAGSPSMLTALFSC
jgi:hypothetical protein